MKINNSPCSISLFNFRYQAVYQAMIGRKKFFTNRFQRFGLNGFHGVDDVTQSSKKTENKINILEVRKEFLNKIKKN